MPTLRAFEVLIAIAEESSISRAARRLHLSQPAVSHQLSGLEKEAGVPLVDRGARGVTLTAQGREFLGYARQAVDAADRAIATARTGSSDATIRLAAAESFTLPFISPVVSRWNANGLPGLEFTETSGTGAVIDALRSGDQDLAIVPGPVHAAGLHVEALGVEEIVAVMAPKSPQLAGPMSMREVADRLQVGVDESNGFHGWIAERFAESGVVQRNSIKTRSLQNAAALAAAGFGVAVVPRSALSPGTDHVLLEPRLRREILAVTRSIPRAAMADLVAAVRLRVTEAAEGFV